MTTLLTRPALVAACLLAGVVAAYATTVTECQQLIAAVKSDTQIVALTGKNAEKDRTGLVGKLDAASLALDRAKFCDAIQKLDDFKVKVGELIAESRINQDASLGVTGQQLLAEADAAIACIADLQIQSTGAGCF